MSSGYQEPGGGTASPSTGTAVGSKPIRAWLKVLRNVDITAEPGYGSTFIPKIQTPFEIKGTSLRIQNPAQTFYTNIESAALLANQSIKVPIITATESGNKKDEVVLLKQGQSLENKTFPTFFDVTETTAPANPSAGTLRIYANSTTHELTQRNSSGTEVKLSDGSGGGGGGAPSDAQYLTLGVNATLTGERVLTGSGRISITDAGPGVTATLDIPTGSIVDSYIGSHTSSKISITTKGQLNSNIVYTDQANTMGDFDQVFRDNRLRINNPADTFSYTLIAAAIGANRNLTLPLLTGNDTAVTEAFSQTLTNKTISGSSNTISNIGDAEIASHTSTKITITTKGQLNSSIAYVDQANVFSDNDQSFRSARLRVANPANTFFYNFTAAAIAANRIINLPLLTGTDTMVTEAFSQTLTNKTINASNNTITNIGDSAIAAHTSTKVTITAKGQLNSNILYGDQNNNFGGFYHDITEIAAPSNPSAGVLRIYANSTTHELTQRDSSGAEKKFSDGSGGSGAPTNSTYLVLSSDGTLSAERIATASSRVTITDAGANSTATFDIGSGSIVDTYIGTHTSTKISITAKGQLNSSIVYTDQANTFGAFDQTFPTSRLLLGDSDASHAYIFAGSNLAANRTVTWPLLTGNDVPVLEAFSQSLTNKTINASSNTITNIGDSAIAAHTSTKVTITAKGQLNSAIVYNDQANVFGANNQTIPIANLLLSNNGNTGAFGVQASLTGTRTWALPNANTQLIGNDTTHTLTNKTYDATGTGNALSNVGDTHIAAHTSTKITITTKGQLNSNIVYTDQANSFGDFDNTFKDNRLKINNPADTFAYTIIGAAIAANRNVTLPLLTGNDTAVTEAFAQTLTNKTIAAGSNTVSGIVDANIDAHTSSKITITTKGQLNSQIVYKDAANTYGDFDQTIRSGKLWLSNPANTFFYQFVGAALTGANRIITLPLLTAGDTMVTEAFAQTLTNKTIAAGSNTISGIVDANIGSHTSTKITITNKSLLNSAILYNDVDNALGAHYVDIDEIAAPGNPAAGKLRVWADSTTHEISQKNSSGTVVKMSDGSGGGGAPTGAQYITLATDGTLTAERVLGAGQNFTFSDPGANGTLTPVIKNIGKAAYDMWRVSSDYFARDNATGTVTTNTNFRTLLNAVNTAMATGGGVIGGTIHLRQGTYILDGSQVLGASATPSYRVRLEGEGIDLTIIKRSGSAGTMFTPECNFEFENLTLDGDAIGTQLISCGEPVRGRLTNVKIARHTEIGVWYGNSLISFITDKCIFEDPRGWQDQHAFTCTEYGIVRGCTFDRLTTVFTSADPAGSCLTSGGGNNILISGNRFTKAAGFQQNGFGCSIEPWDRSYDNVVIADNISQNGIIRVGGGSGVPTTGDWDNNAIMRNIVISGNVVNGAEIGVMGPSTNYTNDGGKIRNLTISNNIINKSNNAGIRLNWLSGQINVTGNTIIDSNLDGASNASNDHGCVWVLTCNDVTFSNNKIYMTATGTNVNPYGLGIQGVDGFIAMGNTFVNTTAQSSYTDFGSSLQKMVKDNYGITDDISHVRQRDSGASLLKMHGNDGVAITLVNAEPGPSPNQHFHILPDLHKQTSATDNQFFFGYNAEFTGFSWNSKWVNGVNPGGANKEYFKIDAGNNLIRFRAPIFIGDNNRLKLNETNLTAEREFTFPDSAGVVDVITATQTLTNKTVDNKNNTLIGVAQNPVYKRWGAYQPITPSSGSTAASVGKLEGILANHVPTGPGTNTNTWDTTEGLLTNLITTTTINQNAGLVSPTGSIGIIRREQATKMVYRGKIDSVGSGVARLYFGVSSNNALNISDTIANADHCVLVGFKAADANYSIYHNDGSSPHATTAITGAIAKNTNFHTIEIEWTAGGNVVVTFDGTAQTISTDLPATTTNLFFHCLAQNATAAIRTHSIVGVWVETL